uniref:Uncharacterized protein n=1 Tax=Anguilla anguilla TaxID=7936 RepID=A0A0E9VRL1_ANGAN
MHCCQRNTVFWYNFDNHMLRKDSLHTVKYSELNQSKSKS